MRLDRPPSRRIAVLVHSLNDGGAQRRLVTLANGFAAAGRDVDFLFATREGAIGRRLDPRVRPIWLGLPDGARNLPLHMGRLRGRKALADYLRAERPSVLLAGSTNVHMLAAATCAGMRRPPALVLRASRHPSKALPRHRLLKRWWDAMRRQAGMWAYNRATRVVAVSGEVGDALAPGLREPGRLAVLPNPIVGPDFAAQVAQPVEHRWLGGDEPLLVGAGRMVAQKDFATMLRAVAAARRVRPVRLLLFGTGPLVKPLARLVRKLGLSDAVELPGSSDDVPAWMARADLVLSSSIYEGSPGVLIEAISAGTPVVATRCPGGSIELVDGDAIGELVPVRDPDAMAAAIVRQLPRGKNAEALAAVAKPYAEEAAVRAYLALLDDAAREVAIAAAD